MFVICLPTMHFGVLKNSFKGFRALQIELEFGSVGFWGELKTGVPGEKPLEARERTSNKLNPHMASTPGFELRATLPMGGECSLDCDTLVWVLSQIKSSYNNYHTSWTSRKVDKGRISKFDPVRLLCTPSICSTRRRQLKAGHKRIISSIA